MVLNMMKFLLNINFRIIVKAVVLSVLIFFSISFFTVLQNINSPINRVDDYHELKIGYPFTYYHEFIVDEPIPNSGWHLTNLILDISLTFITVIGIFWIIKKKRATTRGVQNTGF
jgi:hypothetical protein